MRPFPPTLREKRRYIRFRVHGGAGGEDGVRKALGNAVLSLFGEDGHARSGFFMAECTESSGICRCTHDWLDNVLVALAFVGEVGGERARIEAEAVSGTIKKAR